jgi:hypothetical protein
VHHTYTTWDEMNHMNFSDSSGHFLDLGSQITPFDTFIFVWKGNVLSYTKWFCGVPLHTTFTTLHFLKTANHNTSPETEIDMICSI